MCLLLKKLGSKLKPIKMNEKLKPIKMIDFIFNNLYNCLLIKVIWGFVSCYIWPSGGQSDLRKPVQLEHQIWFRPIVAYYVYYIFIQTVYCKIQFAVYKMNRSKRLTRM